MSRTLWAKRVAVASAVALAWAVMPGASAGDAVKIGDKMPDFKMTDIDGKTHALSDYAGKILVLEFSSQNCPWSRGTDPGISEVAKKYAEKGVVFLGVDADAGNDAAKIKEYATKTGVTFPILKDDQNVYADAVNATRTPEIYIVQDGVLKFHGAYDNRTVPEKAGDVNYVAKALDELLAGKAVSDPTVSAWGCTIKRVAKKA
jgi:peroxiredoxin